ncbi:MAG: hypothetical protein IPH58_15990 [Sphingobacteriales bacterium]|jgi:hypothetical protein|nr:hypothetical protein [Sphingobacteriales bacterium]
MKNKKEATGEGGKRIKAHHKDSELQAVFNYLFRQPATATQVATALNIYRPNLCRRKRKLEKEGRLWEVKKIICPITHYPAMLLTCNPDYAKGGAKQWK